MSSDVPVEVYESELSDEDVFGPLDDLDFDIEVPAAKPVDPWDAVWRSGVERDRYGRPLVKPDSAWGLPVEYGPWPDGGTIDGQLATGERPYVRCSSIAERNDPAFGLGLWKLRHAMLAVGRRPDLQALLTGLTYKDGKKIDLVVEEALIRAKDDRIYSISDDGEIVSVGVDGEGWDAALTAANRGTAVHALTAPATGPERPRIDPMWGPTLAQYAVSADALADALDRLGLVEITHEGFGVSHVHGIAGTFDHLFRATRELRGPTPGRPIRAGSVLIMDKKSGKLQPVSHVTQMEGYASLSHYDPATGATRPLADDLDPTVGLLAGIDLRDGVVKIMPVDLTRGYLARAVASHRASLAAAVKDLVGRPL